jgi:hypothetical protein
MARRHYSERHRTQRVKNYAVLIVLVSLCIIFYVVFITRAGLLG